MGTYIDFLETMPCDISIIREFQTLIKNCSADELSRWFKKIGYDVSSAECGIILKNRKTNYLAVAAMLPY
jgi:hypothetical protein